MTRRIPPFLQSGDTIGITATARWIGEEELNFAVGLLESWGYRVRLGKYLHKRHFQLAGDDSERAEDLQEMLDDPGISAILIARGGYGTIRIADRLDFSSFKKNPKWICGYSDITVLHAQVNQLGFASIHSTMPVSFAHATAEALENLRFALAGELDRIEMIDTENPASTGLPVLPVFGGNLSVIYSMLGSGTFDPQEDCYLFIEDVDEMLYHIDRMMLALSRTPWFRHVRAILCGGFTQMKDNTQRFGFTSDNPWGSDAPAIVRSVGELAAIPVFVGFPAGHQEDNRAFYLGYPTEIHAMAGNSLVTFQHHGRNKF